MPKKVSKKNYKKKVKTKKNIHKPVLGAFKFCDGKSVYKRFNKLYKKHKKGYVILGAPGIGKTTFIKNQGKGKRDWVDSDDLLGELGVKWDFNSNNESDFKLNYLRADYMLEQSKLLGYRIIGSLFWEYKADAIVNLPLDIHKEYLKNRKDISLDVVLEVRELLLKLAKKNNIPVFDSIQGAVDFLENQSD